MFSYLHQPKGFYKHLFLLALPVIVQNLITTSLGFLDTFMVGLLGSDQMSAVTVANVPVFIIQLVVFGLQSGSSVLISQYWGRGDRESINRVMGIGFMIAGGVSVLFAAILCAFPAQVLYLITDNLTLVELAEPYLRIVGFSYIFNSLSSIYIGMQRSIENPRFGMIVFAISMLCNTLGNYVLIFGKLGLPALGITGAAVATLLSRVVEFVVAFSYAFRCRTMPLMKHAILRPGMDMLRKFLRYSAPVLINETLWGTGFSMITVIMGHMANSSDLIAAYTLAGNIDKLMTSGVFGIADAVSVIVGKEIGIGSSHESVVRIGKAVCLTAFLFALALGGVLRAHGIQNIEDGMALFQRRPDLLPVSAAAVQLRLMPVLHPDAEPLNGRLELALKVGGVGRGVGAEGVAYVHVGLADAVLQVGGIRQGGDIGRHLTHPVKLVPRQQEARPLALALQRFRHEQGGGDVPEIAYVPRSGGTVARRAGIDLLVGILFNDSLCDLV